MGRARSQTTAVAVDGFDTVFGVRRGHLGELTPQLFARILGIDGVDEAVGAIGDRTRLLTEPQLATALCDHVFTNAYELAQPRLRAWLRAVGVRPGWSLNVGLDVIGGGIHIFPRGHLIADSADTHVHKDARLVSACGLQLTDISLLNRGLWLKRPQNPVAGRVCSACAAFAAEYPETQTRDSEDLLPAPTLDAALARWRAVNKTTVLSNFVDGVDVNTVNALLVPQLDDIALTFAARMLHLHPRPNILRVLRAGAPEKDWSHIRSEELELVLDESEWREPLHHSLAFHSRQTLRGWEQSWRQSGIIWAQALIVEIVSHRQS
jgi:hypothetical protein